MMGTKILVLASGRGTDFQAIADHYSMGIFKDVSIAGLVSNHNGAEVIGRAEKEGVTPYVIEGVTGREFGSSQKREDARSHFDESCIELVKRLGVDLIVLAGFDQIISRPFVDSCKFKIVNIHPAYDLKRFGGKNMVGMRVHEEVLHSRVAYSGCTVHYVTNDIDGGPAILKRKVDISAEETPDSLEKKILGVEHLVYPEAIQLVADGRVFVDDTGKKCFVDRYSDGWDIDWDLRQQRYIAAVQQ